jgi:hypothetical protein
MTRGLDIDLGDAIKETSEHFVHFFEFLTPDSTSGPQLTRVHQGLLHDRNFNNIAGMAPLFEVISGTWNRDGEGALRAQYNGGAGMDQWGRTFLRYNGYTGDIANKVIQTVMRRDPAGAAANKYHGMVGTLFNVDWDGITSTLVEPYNIMENGNCNTEGPCTWDVTQGALNCSVLFHSQFFPIINTIVDGDSGCAGAGLRGHTNTANCTLPNLFQVNWLCQDLTAFAHGDGGTKGRVGFSVRWKDTNILPTVYDEDVYFDALSIYESMTVTVNGLPPGWRFEVRDPYDDVDPESRTYWHGGLATILVGSAAGTAGTSVVTANGGAYPYKEIRIYDQPWPGGNLIGTFTIGDGKGTALVDPYVWGGDIYLFESGLGAPILNLCDADMDIDWDSKTWTGVGRENIGFDTIHESPDKRAQGATFQFSSVDRDVLLQEVVDNDRFRGTIMKLWRGHFDTTTGQLRGEPVLLFCGHVQGGFEVEESRVKTGRPTSDMRVRVSSRLAELDRTNGLRTNQEIHQTYYPGDTFFQNVANIAGRKIFWLSEPDSTDRTAVPRP